MVVDADGNSLIDLGSGIAVTTPRQRAPLKVVAAIAAQAAQFTHTCFMISPYEGYVAVAEALNRLTPGDFEKRSALFNSGAEAVENAVKIARKFTGRQAVAFDHACLPRPTNLTMGLTAKSMLYKSGWFSAEIYRALMSYPYRDGLAGAEAASRAISLMESRSAPTTRRGDHRTDPGRGRLHRAGRRLCRRSWTGAGPTAWSSSPTRCSVRSVSTGVMFASELFGIVPDLVATAKGIAGGMLLAGYRPRRRRRTPRHTGGLGGTYGGNSGRLRRGAGRYRCLRDRGAAAASHRDRDAAALPG